MNTNPANTDDWDATDESGHAQSDLRRLDREWVVLSGGEPDAEIESKHRKQRETILRYQGRRT